MRALPVTPARSKSVVITGASSGLGKAAAIHLSALGYRVFAGVRSESSVAELSGLSTSPGELIPVLLDVTSAASIAQAGEILEHACLDTGLWAVVNNAGLCISAPLECVPMDLVRSQLETNLVGALAVTQRFLPLLRASGGRIVNVSSGIANHVPPYAGAYAAAKFGMEGLSDALRRELHPLGVSVSVVQPGVVCTPIWGKIRESADDILAAAPVDVVDVYRSRFVTILSTSEAVAQVSKTTTTDFADAVAAALAAKRPKIRYRVGLDSRGAALARRALPDRMMDTLISFEFKAVKGLLDANGQSMVGITAAAKHAENIRRRTKRLVLKGGTVLARRQLHRKPVRPGPFPTPKESELQPIPGDKGLPILGHALAAATLPVEFLESRATTYGPVSWMRGFALPFVLALGPDASQEVFANSDRVFSQQGQEFFSGRFFNRGLMFLDFAEHHFHRRIMQAAFTRERLSGYLQSMNTICRAAAAEVPEHELLVYPYLKRTLLDIATVAFMGDEPGPQSDLMNQAFTQCLHAATAVVRVPVPGLRWWAGIRGRRTLEQHFRTNIDARRSSDGDDLFAALCRARDEDGNQFTDDDAINHMIFLMSAATDTSAAAATATLHQLALHPEWQDRVRAEAAEIADGPLDLDTLDRMQSLGMVINESMRLFAPVPVIFRKTLADTSIQGYFVPADTMVVVAPLLNHYWPGLWSDPHTFDPERFSEARREDRSHRLAFVPFGAGAHKCIGMHFATVVVKLVIHHLLREHRIELRSGYTLEWDMTALPAPTDGFPVLIRRIDDAKT
ncbi:cytochrome P450 [Mycobacterium kiyosense]|uniref:cytochrome P450 n=1 Tax=Mycobacterium kiyosense TaxID=2871094 RepID=UPI0022304273|nr:cytochrome P450 [Mycobacterium kiyosense]